MASTHYIPPDTSEEEKIVGGILTKTQLIWIILGAGIGIIFALVGYALIGIIGFILVFPPIGYGIYFATKKVENMTLFQYLIYKHRYKKKTKIYINKGYHSELDFTGQEEH